MSRGKGNAKQKILSAAAGIFIVSALLISLSEQGVLPLNLPTWNEIFIGTDLKYSPVDETPQFSVHYIDVGQGDCAFIKSPDGCVLIDGGDNGYGEKVIGYLKDLNVSSIDYVIATHPHTDHIGGLDEVIEAFEVENIIMPRLTAINTPTTQCYEDLLMAVRSSGAKVTAAKPDAEYKLGKVYILILSPSVQSEDLNDMSVVTRVSYGGTFFLFMGDASTAVEKQLLKNNLNCLSADILKAGHHGSKYSSSTAFLNEVRPSEIVISCGAGNSYGHPHDQALKRMKKTEADILRTDRNGTIVIRSDGATLSTGTAKE